MIYLNFKIYMVLCKYIYNTYYIFLIYFTIKVAVTWTEIPGSKLIEKTTDIVFVSLNFLRYFINLIYYYNILYLYFSKLLFIFYFIYALFYIYIFIYIGIFCVYIVHILLAYGNVN